MMLLMTSLLIWQIKFWLRQDYSWKVLTFHSKGFVRTARKTTKRSN